jgi:uncharacterized protein YkwD
MTRTLASLAILVLLPASLWPQGTPKTGPKETPKEAPKGSSEFKLTDEEKTILEMTNAARKEKDLPPLLVNATLTKCARAHSDNMAKQMKMAHELDGKSPFDRLKDVGYSYRRAAENVAFGDGAAIEDLFRGWMNSEGHRKNILDPAVSEIGIGLSTTGRVMYATQVFGKQLK